MNKALINKTALQHFLKLCVLIYAAAVMGVGLAFASPDKPKRIALVIGNSAYEHTAHLVNPFHDATDLSAVLKRLDFTVITGLDLNRAKMMRKIRAFTSSLNGADVALFFYAGHGLQNSGQNYLVPTDAKLTYEQDLDFEAVGLNLVLKQMERESKLNLIFLDACRDNPLAQKLSRSMGTRSSSLGRGLGRVDTGVGTLISFSTQPGNVALDGDSRNSPYTRALLTNIEKKNLDINRLMIAVRREVLKLTEGKQVPWEHSSLTGEFYFKIEGKVTISPAPNGSAPAQAPTKGSGALSAPAEAWSIIRQTKDPDVLNAFIDQYGKTFYGTLAKQKLKKISRKQALAKPPTLTPAPSNPKQQPTLPASITGRYICQGKNPNGSKYTGLVSIAKAANIYHLAWKIGKTSYRGSGKIKGNILTVNWGSKYPVIYLVGADGVLRGTWSNGRAEETLFPKR